MLKKSSVSYLPGTVYTQSPLLISAVEIGRKENRGMGTKIARQTAGQTDIWTRIQQIYSMRTEGGYQILTLCSVTVCCSQMTVSSIAAL